MIAAGVIGIMLIILIFFVVRAQNLQRELKIANHATRQSQYQVKLAQRQLVFMSSELQKIFLGRAESLHKRGLISEADYVIVFFILKHFEFIVMNCSEYGLSVEEALKKALKHQTLKLSEIMEFIKTQPSDVRVAWSQNKMDGFVAACRAISIGNLNTQAADKADAVNSQ